MVGRNEDGTSKNEVDLGVLDEVLCIQCGRLLNEHEGCNCGWQN